MYNISIDLNDELGMIFFVQFKNEYLKDFDKTTNEIVEMIKKFELDDVEALSIMGETVISAEADEFIAIGELGILMLDVESLLKEGRKEIKEEG